MSKAPRHRRPLIEALEPRLLFSATADIAVFDHGIADVQHLADAAHSVDLVSIYMPDDTHPLMMPDAPTDTPHIDTVIFVDTAVDNYQTLVKDLESNLTSESVAIVYLDTAKDGLAQISDYLAGVGGVSAVHIISHGVAGSVQLGSLVLDENNIDQYQQALGNWKNALDEDADILLYGCDLAANQSGINFLRQLSELTGADVAASNDLTGNDRASADWVLEENIGTVETASLFTDDAPMEWQGTLADVHYVSIPAANNEHPFSSTRPIGQTFQYTVGSYTVDQISVQLLKLAGAANQTITLELRNDWNGTVLKSASISSSVLTNTFQWVNFNFSDANLSVNTVYWVRISSSGTDELVRAAFHTSSVYSQGNFIDNGASNGALDLAMRVSNSDGVNAAPTVANPIANQNVNEGVALNYSFPSNSFNDPDGDNLSYTAKLADGNPLPAWLQFNQATRTFSGVADDGNVGTISIRVTATDGNGLSVYDDFNLTVNNVPEQPYLLTPNPDQVASGFTPFSYQFPAHTFGDPDGNPIVSYRATLADGSPLPSWLTLNQATSTFSGTPTNADAGTITIRLYATDSTGMETPTPDEFNIVISATVNDAPVNTVPGAQSTNEDTALVFSAGNSNQIQIADADALSASVRVTLSVSNGLLTLGGTAGLSFTTGDGTNDATLVFTGTVANINAALATLTYTPANNYTGSDTLSIVTNDLGNSGTGGAKSDSDTVAITVNAVNDAPVNTVPGAQSTNEDTALVFSAGNSNQIQMNDVDAGSSNLQVTLSVTNGTLTLAGTGGLSFTTGDGTADSTLVFTGTRTAINNALATLTFNPTANYNGGAVLSLTTSDLGNTGSGGAKTDIDTVNITINPANDAPTVAVPLGDQNATEDAFFTYTFASNSFNDIDGNTLSYSAQLNGGASLPSWLSFNSATRTFSGTPLNANVGSISIDVIANDGNGGTVTDTFTLTVANTNDAPTVANTIPNQNATEDVVFTFQFDPATFNDQDAGSSLTYTALLAGGGALPAWLSFNPTTRTFSGTPANGDVGTISVRVTADDGLGGTVSDVFDITVANTNDAPTVSSPIPDQSATQTALFNFSFDINTFNDQDTGTTLTYTAQLAGGGSLPGWLSFDPATRTFSGTPTNGDVGTISIEVTASDGAANVSDTFNIVIGNIDDSPVLLNPIPNQNATEDVAYSFQFSDTTFDDPDVGDTLTYTATLSDNSPLPGWLHFDALTRTFSGTPANSDVGTITIKVTAADNDGGPVATDTFDLVVANSNDAPTILNPIGNQNATEDAAFNFTFAADTFIDQDTGDSLTYIAQGVGATPLPAWLSFDTATRTFSGTPLNAHVGTVTIEVVASDGHGGSVTDSFTITVANTNDVPTLNIPISDQNATEDVAFNFQFDSGTFGDDDLDTLSYTARLVGGGVLPAWLSFDSAARTFSGTPTNGDVGTLSIEVIANDGNGGTVSDSFDLVIANVNDAPIVNIIPTDYNADEQVVINLHGTGISVADVDGDPLTITVSGTGAGSELTANAGTSGVIIVSGNGSNSLVLTGTAAQLNDFFAGNNGGSLTYRLADDAPPATRLLTITASDGSLSGNDTASIHIAAINDTPVNTVPGAQATNEDTALVFSSGSGNLIQVNDPDVGAGELEVTLSVTNGTLTLAGIAGLGFTTGDGTADATMVFHGTQADINTALATLTFNPAANYHGAAVLTITTSDQGNTGSGGTLADSDNIAITINAVNDAPTVASPISDQNATEDTPYSFQFSGGTFVDADLDTLTYSASLAGGGLLPSWLSFDATTRTFSGTPANADVGTIAIEVTASDGNGGTVTDTFDLQVDNSNDAPTVAIPISNQTATEATAFNFQFGSGTFNDVDAGDILTYSATLNGGGALPGWLAFDAVTRTFSGVPTTADVGTLTIDVTASDGKGGTVTDTFTLTINGLPDTEYIDTGNGGGFVPVSSGNTVGQSFSYDSLGATYTVNEISLSLARYDNAAPQTITVELRDAWNGAVLASDSIPSSQISRDGFGWHSFSFAGVALNDQQTYVIQVSSSGNDDLVLVSRIAGNVYPDGTMIENGVPDAGGWDLAFKIAKDDGNNSAPVLDNPIVVPPLDAEDPFTLVVPANTFSDPDPNDTITYRAQLAGGGSMGWLTFNEATKTFAGTPHWHQAGTITVELIATDNHGASTSAFFDIEVINTNNPPTVANPIPDQVVNEDSPLNFQFDSNTFTDADAGHTFTYSAQLAVLGGLPPWLSFDAATRTFSGTPTNGDVGDWTVEVTADDGFGGTVIDTFVITVANTNDAPTLANPIVDQGATENTAFSFQLPLNTFADIDIGDTFMYSAQLAGGGALPAWLSFDAVTRTFSGTPGTADIGTLSIEVVASDSGGLIISDTFDLVIDALPANLPPAVQNGIDNQSVAEDSAFVFTIPGNAFSDAEGDALSYSVQLAGGGALPSWLSFDAATRTFSGTPVNGDVGVINLQVTVSDGNGGSASDNFSITVINTNDAPTLDAPTINPVAQEDSPFTLSLPLTMFSDVDVGDSLGYSAQLANGQPLPDWLQFDAGTFTFSGTPGNNDVGDLTIQLIASDGEASVSFQFVIRVEPVNDAPVATGSIVINNVEDAPGDQLDLFATFSDEETAANQMQYTVVSNSNPGLVIGASIDAATGKLTFTYGANQFGSCDLVVRAQDADGAFVDTRVQINIASVNDVPVSTGIVDIRVNAGAAPWQMGLHNIFSDIEEGTSLKYSLIANTNPAIVTNLQWDQATGAMTITFASATGGESFITLRAQDSDGAWVETRFKVTVVAPSTGPGQPDVPVKPPVTPPTVPPGPEVPTPPTTPPPGDNHGNNPGTGNPGGGITAPPETGVDTNIPGMTDQGGPPFIDTGDARDNFTPPDDKSSRDYERMQAALAAENVPVAARTASSSLVSLITTDAGFAPWEAADFDNEVRRIREQMDVALEEEQDRRAVVAGITLSLTTGLLVWSLRASSLLLTLMSMLPLWRGLDPLPILDEVNKRKKELEQQRKDRAREDKSAKEVGYLFDHAQHKQPEQ